MAEVKKASLTVLGGPLTGARCVLPEAGSVTVGSAEGSTLRLEIAGVSPLHARIVVEAGGRTTVHETGSERRLYVNDNPVEAAGTVLRNGDILWLGTPGDDRSVMLQCLLPRRPVEPHVVEAPAPAAPEPARADVVVPAAGFVATAVPEPEPAIEQGPSEAAGDAALQSEDDLVFVEEQAEEPQVEQARFGQAPFEQAPYEEAPFEPAQVDEAQVAPVEAAEVLEEEAPQPDEAPAVTPHMVLPDLANAFGPPEAGRVAGGGEIVEETEPEAFISDEYARETIIAPAESVETIIAGPESAETMIAPPETAETIIEEAVEPPPAARPVQAAPQQPAASPPPEARPQHASHPPHAARPLPPQATHPPHAAHPPHASHAAHARRPQARKRSGSGARSALMAVGGLAGLAVVGGLAWAGWHFYLQPRLAGTPTGGEAPQALAQATPTPVPVGALPPPVTLAPEGTVPPAPEASPSEPPVAAGAVTPTPAALVATPTPAPTPARAATPSPTPSPRATPTPRPTPASAQARPAPPTTASGPSAEDARAQQTAQVQSLVTQAEAALAARQYDAAVGHADAALRLDPANARATSLRGDAARRRDLSRRRFVAGRTVVQSQKKSGGIEGFDSGDADVRQAPDFSGRIEFVMSPPTGLESGASWTLQVFVVNDGKKEIRVQGVAITTSVNGAAAPSAVPPRARSIDPQQRALVGELTGSWKDGTTSWTADASIQANKGDSLRNTLSWR